MSFLLLEVTPNSFAISFFLIERVSLLLVVLLVVLLFFAPLTTLVAPLPFLSEFFSSSFSGDRNLDIADHILDKIGCFFMSLSFLPMLETFGRGTIGCSAMLAITSAFTAGTSLLFDVNSSE